MTCYGRGYERAFLPGFCTLLLRRCDINAVSFPVLARLLVALAPARTWRSRVEDWLNACMLADGSASLAGTLLRDTLAGAMHTRHTRSDSSVEVGEEEPHAAGLVASMLKSDAEMERAVQPVLVRRCCRRAERGKARQLPVPCGFWFCFGVLLLFDACAFGLYARD